MRLLVGQLIPAETALGLDGQAKHNQQLAQKASASLLRAGLCGKCPRCAKGKLFSHGITVVDHCAECGLALREHEKGDGPAFFAIIIVGGITCALAVAVELTYQPPYWVHAVLWLPFIAIASLITLRVAKASIIAVQYKHRVSELVDDN